jgi:hypothetical protein
LINSITLTCKTIYSKTCWHKELYFLHSGPLMGQSRPRRCSCGQLGTTQFDWRLTWSIFKSKLTIYINAVLSTKVQHAYQVHFILKFLLGTSNNQTWKSYISSAMTTLRSENFRKSVWFVTFTNLSIYMYIYVNSLLICLVCELGYILRWATFCHIPLTCVESVSTGA